MSDKWTLQINGTTKSFQDWGFFAPVQITRVNKAKSSITIETTEEFDAAGQFGYGLQAVFKKNGTQVFVGYVGAIGRGATSGRRSISYTFYDLWWLMERLVYKQHRTQFSGWTGGIVGGTPIETLVFSSRVYLGESLDAFGTHYQANGDQIKDVLTFLNECYNPTRRGTVGAHDSGQDVVQIGQIDPAIIIPKSVLTNPFCSDMVTNLLRFSPDAVIKVDYSFSPPKFNIFSEANHNPRAVNLVTDRTRGVKITPKFDRQLAGVWIYYESSVNNGGVDWPSLVIDKYPDTAYPGYNPADGPTITEYTPDVSVHTIGLSGSHVGLKTTLVTAPWASIYGGTLDDQKAWIIARDPSLQDPNVNPASIQVLTPPTFVVTDDITGEEITDFSATPNELLYTAQPAFVGGTTRVVNISAKIKYDQHIDDDHVILSNSGARTFHKQITLTSAIGASYVDRSIGEAAPTGLAKSIFDSLKLLKHEGQITLNGSQWGDLGPGDTLIITGPNNTYSRLPVQSATSKPHSEDVEVQFGPSAVLDANDLVELIRATRFAKFEVPSGRDDPGGAGIEL